VNSTPPLPSSRLRPFSGWWPFAAGALIGIGLRLVFWGSPGEPYAVITAAFIFLAPLAVGAVTVYFAERRKRRTWWYYAWASMWATALAVLGTLLIMVEGLICAIIILPLFALIGALGGLIMGLVCRFTDWPKPTVSCIVLLPLMLGGADLGIGLPQTVAAVERTTIVSASPAVVWQQVLNAPAIRPSEINGAGLFRIGVPLPLEGELQTDDTETLRRVRMAKDVYFDEVIQERREQEFLRWTYRFYADSFPPYALDEHVVIGGHYFDVIDTSYSLTPSSEETRLTVRLTYRISTNFNWYARPVMQLLLGNLIAGNLGYYRARSEAAAAGIMAE
jgi:hypothetical protein